MLIRILGSAAGGGFPQWNCNCPRCRGVREGTLHARARTQSSLAVRGSNDAWALVNASPDVLQQLRAYPDLQDRKSTRLNSSHLVISYAVFCLKKKTTKNKSITNVHK